MPKIIKKVHDRVQVQFPGTATKYTYAVGDLKLAVGDTVLVSSFLGAAKATVVALGSDYKGKLSFVIKKVADGKGAFPAAAPLAAAPAVSLSAVLGDDAPAKLPPHLIVKALAGTGKTTTLIEGLKQLLGLPTTIVPSDQQRAIWDALMLSKGAGTVCITSLTNTIVDELRARVPNGVQAQGMHSMGFAAVRKAFRLKSEGAVNKHRTSDIVAELLGADIWQLRRQKPVVVKATIDLVGKCKINLISVPDCVQEPNWTSSDQIEEWWATQLTKLANHHQIELGDAKQREEIFSLVPQVLERCKDVEADGCIDFNDQIWLPVVLNLPMPQIDLLLVDEAQDLNRCQQEIAKRVGRRLVLVGDEHQAIFGFAGADVESMRRLEEELKSQGRGTVTAGPGCQVLPLTITRRCGRAIVKEAQRHVLQFEAHASNPDGKVGQALYPIQGGGWDAVNRCRKDTYEIDIKDSYVPLVREGDFVLCSRNAPLVKEFFRFIKFGLRAFIVGREFGQGLVNLLNEVCGDARIGKATFAADVRKLLALWLDGEQAKERAKKNPEESVLEGLQDRHDALWFFAEQSTDLKNCTQRIELAFGMAAGIDADSTKREGVRLSSIHKAKGLEAKRVFILQPVALNCRIVRDGPKVKPWELVQSCNLEYVAVTRAIEELVYVS